MEIIKLLKHHEDLFFKAQNNYDACKILSEDIMPIMRIAASSSYNGWCKKITKRIKSQLKNERKAFIEAKEYFELLKQRIMTEGLLKESSIKQVVCCIETILSFGLESEHQFKEEDIEPTTEVYLDVASLKKGKKLKWAKRKKTVEIICINCGGLELSHRIHVLPSYVYGLCKAIENLCDLLFDLGFQHLIEDKVEIKNSCIYKFNFASSFYALEELNNPLKNENDDLVWLEFEWLHRIEWAWKLSRYFLKDKKLDYRNAKNCTRSRNLLLRNHLRLEVDNLKPNQKKKKYTFFCDREYIKKNLDVVLSKIYNEQSEQALTIDNFKIPYSLKLMIINHKELVLIVEWVHGIVQFFYMHTFYDISSDYSESDDFYNVRYNFIVELLDSPGNLAQMDPQQAAINAGQYLNKVGIRGIIYKLFILKKTRYGAILKNKKIVLTGESPATLKKVIGYIEGLEPYVCEKCKESYHQITDSCLKDLL